MSFLKRGLVATTIHLAIATVTLAETDCSHVRGFNMRELPVVAGEFVAITASSSTSRGGETALDIDRDGVVEAAALKSSGEVIVLEGLKASGSAGTPVKIKPAHTISFKTGIVSPTNLRFGDMDGDGAPDLIVTTTSRLTVFFNNREGGFGSPLTSSATDITNLAFADFNGDTKLDIATVDALGVKTIRGNNSRSMLNTWTSSANLSSSFFFVSPLTLRVAYPSTKKLPGLVIGGLSNGFLTYSLLVLDTLSTPTSIKFSASTNRSFLLPSSISSVERVDLNGDGLQDLVTLRNDTGDLTPMQNTGIALRDLKPVRISNGPLPYSALTTAGDFLLDSRHSVLVSIPKERVVKLYSWISSAFSLVGRIPTRGALTSMGTPQDMDKDGDLDVIAIGSYEGGTYLTLLRNDRRSTTCDSPPSNELMPDIGDTGPFA